MKIEIEGHPPGVNALDRMVWQERARVREQWKMAAWALSRAAWDGRVLDPVILRVTWEFAKRRRRDLDNLISGLKPVIDGIKEAGVIIDDDLDHIVGIEARWRRGQRDLLIVEVLER